MSAASRADEHELSGPQRAELLAVIDAEHQRALRQAAALGRDFDEIVEATDSVATDDEHDPEGATIAYERAKVAALRAQVERDLGALDEVRDRVQRRTATTCERCGRTVAFERLIALPTTLTCVACARGA